MKLYQRGRVWYLTFYVRGKRVQESTGTSDRRKAEKFCASVNTQNRPYVIT
jgi:hypothetical protein